MDKKQQQKYFDNISQDYGKQYSSPSGIMALEKVQRLRTALSLVDFSDKEKVVDIGVGSGNLFQELPENVDCIGIDFSRSMIESAKKMQNASYIQASIDELPIKTSSVNKVFCLGVLGYLEENQVKQGINEISRILNRNGELILSFANSSSIFRKYRNFYYYKFLEFIKRVTGLGTPTEHTYTAYRPKKIIKLLKNNNLKIKNKRYLTYSTGIRNTWLNKKIYWYLEQKLSRNELFGRLSMTWVMKLKKEGNIK